MAMITGIQFQKNGKIYNYDTNNLEISQGDYVVADTSHGLALGQAVISCRQLDENEIKLPLKKIIRIATEKDLQISAENRQKEREAYEVCQKKIAEHKLDMKLVSVEYSFDNSKALFYFTANGRVDFRSLVKDLASVFKMRIELRQIGVRDEARMLGGLGPCGRPICCGAFLEEFQPVSIKMAKEQNLSLNPTKISGVCGRLMCCLKYEQEHYEQTRKIMPRIGKEVITPDGNGIVSDLNILKETVFVRIANGDSCEIKEYPLDKIVRSVPGHSQGTGERQNSAGNSTTADNIPAKENGSESKREDAASQQEQKRNVQPARNGRNNGDVKKKEHKKTDKDVNPRQKANLGKPVLRENPNKTAVSAAQTPADVKAESAPNWAEAVRKAIDSMN